MIEKIINGGHYKFTGNIKDLKNRLGGFKIIEVLNDVYVDKLHLYTCLAEFKYHGMRHRVEVMSDFSGKDILNITYKGAREIK